MGGWGSFVFCISHKLSSQHYGIMPTPSSKLDITGTMEYEWFCEKKKSKLLSFGIFLFLDKRERFKFVKNKVYQI